MTDDWKDILAGLKTDDTPAAENADSSETPDDTSGAVINKRPTLTIFYEKKGRAGKPATIITGFDADDEESLNLAVELASTLKKRLGCGGAARDGEILLQGDRRERLRQMLPDLGYTRIKG